MIFNEALCEKYIAEEKVYAAHIVLKVMRGDFVVGKTTIDDWINVLGSDDAYLIFRIIESNEKDLQFGGSSFDDIRECVRLMLFIENEVEPSNDAILLKCNDVHKKIMMKDRTHLFLK